MHHAITDDGERTTDNASNPQRPLSTTLTILALWIVFYASFTLVHPALLDDADSVHAEVAREMLLRHDWVTLYANGIRYLEKAPMLYWSMAACMRASQLLGHASPQALAIAARIPLALTVLALAFAVEVFARQAFRSARAGLYAALILLSSPGIFLYTRILLPDVMLCLWLTLAMYFFWLTEQPPTARVPRPGSARAGDDEARVPHSSQSHRDESENRVPRPSSAWAGFSVFCALGVLTKGFIGIVFPIGIVALYLLLTRGLRGALRRLRELHPFTSALVFLAVAAPWHILAALANPTQGSPGGTTFSLHASPHWTVPLPTQGNVHGWAWFYFINEQVLRYLNLRVPRDYGTVPLWLFWGLMLIWLMPWSAFLFNAITSALRSIVNNRHPERSTEGAQSKDPEASHPAAKARRFLPTPFTSSSNLLLLLWAALPLLFFSLSTRQEYYVLPSLPALAILTANWLSRDKRRAALRCTAVLATLGAVFAAVAIYFLLHTHTPPPNADLASLLEQNPGDYALSMGHFLDLDTRALSLFRLPLALAAAGLFLGPLSSYLLRRVPHSSRSDEWDATDRVPHPPGSPASSLAGVDPSSAWVGSHPANLALAAGAFTFLLAVHMGYATFAPVLSSAQLAEAIAPQLAASPNALLVIHQEYEYASTLGFYLQRPSYDTRAARPIPHEVLHILTDPAYHPAEQVPGSPYGRSSNLYYGSFFPDAPDLFETTATLAAKWHSPQRIFLWQSLDDQPGPLPAALTPAYVIARSGGKEIVSNQPNR